MWPSLSWKLPIPAIDGGLSYPFILVLGSGQDLQCEMWIYFFLIYHFQSQETPGSAFEQRLCSTAVVCVGVWLASWFCSALLVTLDYKGCGTCSMTWCNGFNSPSSTDRYSVKQAGYWEDCETSVQWSTRLGSTGEKVDPPSILIL